MDQLLGKERRCRKGHGTELLRLPKWNDEGLAHGPIKQHHQLVILPAGKRHHLSMEALHHGALRLGSPCLQVAGQTVDDGPRGQDISHHRDEQIGAMFEG